MPSAPGEAGCPSEETPENLVLESSQLVVPDLLPLWGFFLVFSVDRPLEQGKVG